ncbi:fungal transcriptional regulatory protein [Pochonia chlamydosporia 170]|uniref:Fungal transcriptional regulatory protein n=1 Tax=Pochonia chlamydosporia 170 TaxID=1380566 RepID=A0A179FA18_METCM|nr:fungal transcriptional regulatory protein [Pochonia chlamydosporia 170]OAQ62375.1 fungal transcriptional regulatory protein [Pochonia chlamydosporia 170]
MSLRKIRTYRSCQSCRLSKTKCNGDRPKCARCAAKLIQCVYDGGAAPRWTRNLNRSQATSVDDDAGSSSPTEQDAMTGVAPSEVDETASLRGSVSKVSDEANDKSSIIASEAAGVSVTGAASQHGSNEQLSSHPLAWLLSPALPATRNLRRVVEQYFSNVHPLRCFAFVHKPSFMRQLDKGFSSDDESALLHIICAHGAKFLVLGAAQGEASAPPSFLKNAGNQWAKRAEYLMLANFGKISVQRLMTAILLHDFHFRLGEYGQALMISGLAVRMAHALKINTEYNSDILCTEENNSAPSVASRESRRRLMWACYVLDAWAGSGVDQLTLLRENDIKIQLPSNERNFGLRIPSVTETLGVGHVLQFLPPAIVPRKPAANMGIMAYYIRVVALWKRIVRYVNHLHAGPPPWQPDSLFAALDADLHLWRRELPDFVEYSTETIYARLDSNQLGSLVLIHCTYHHNYLELYKLTMPDLFKLSKPFTFPPEHDEFLQTAQANAYYHAQQIADILAEAAEHGSRLLSDSLLPFFVYDSSRVMLYYVARLLDPNRPDAEVKLRDAVKAVESNNRVLRMMSTLFPIAQSLSATIERWLSKVQQTVARDDLLSSLEDDDHLESHRPVMSNGNQDRTAEYVLPPLSLHSLARSGAGESGGIDGEVASRTASWSTQNPHAGGPASWDGTSAAAHQLVGLSQEQSVRSSLQHERPVPVHPFRKVAPSQPMCNALDLDDLQNFLSWDMYGIMEMGGSVSNEDMDDSVSQSWTGAI